MNCFQAEELIQWSLDGPLSTEDRRALEVHLEHCAACCRAREEYRRLSRLATAWTKDPVREAAPGDDFTARVMARIAFPPAALSPQNHGRRPHRSLVLVVLMVAVAAFSFAVGPYLLTTVTPPVALTMDLLPTPRTVVEVPGWLREYLRALPQDGKRLWSELLRWCALPPVGVREALAAAVLLNALFFLHALRSSPRNFAR